jgi:hypothetical protein
LNTRLRKVPRYVGHEWRRVRIGPAAYQAQVGPQVAVPLGGRPRRPTYIGNNGSAARIRALVPLQCGAYGGGKRARRRESAPRDIGDEGGPPFGEALDEQRQK